MASGFRYRLRIVFLCVSLICVAGFGFADDSTSADDTSGEFDRLATEADELIAKDDFEKALPLLERLYALDPENLLVIEWLGKIYTILPDAPPEYVQALKFLNEASTKGSEDNIVYYFLGCIHASMGRSDEAIRQLETAFYHGYTDLDTMLDNADFDPIRKTEWWGSVERNKVEIGKALTQYWDTVGSEEELSAKDRRKRLSEVDASLRNLVPACSLVRVLAMDNLGGICLEDGDLQGSLTYREQALALMNRTFGESFTDAPTFQNKVGIVQFRMGEWDKSIDSFSKAVALSEALGVARSLDVAQFLDNGGDAYAKKGDASGAIRMYLQELELRIVLSDKTDSKVPNLLNAIGIQYMQKADYSKAFEYFERALSAQIAITGEKNLNAATMYNNIGKWYLDAKNFAKALEYDEKALSIQRELCGEESVEAAESYHTLGDFYRQTGDLPKALSFQEDAYRIFLAHYGERNESTLWAMNNLGAIYGAMGDYTRAIEFLDKALATVIELRGESNNLVAIMYTNLGEMWLARGDYTRSRYNNEKALAIQLKVFGEMHQTNVNIYNNLGNSYVRQGDYENALANYLNALRIQNDIFGSENVISAKVMNNIGFAYSEMGDYDKARSFYERALAICLSSVGPWHTDVATTYNNLALVYGSMRDYAKAEELLKKTLEIRVKALGESHTDVAMSYLNLGYVYLNTRDFDGSIWYTQKALDVYRKAVGEDHLDTAIAYNNLGEGYRTKGQNDMALSCFEKALAIRRKLMGDSYPDCAGLLNNIGIVYLSQGDFVRASAYCNDSLTILDKSCKYMLAIEKAWDYIKLGNFHEGQEDGIGSLTELSRNSIDTGIRAVERARIDLSSARTGIMAKSIPLYFAGIDLELRKGDRGKAFAYSEAMRSRGFLDQMGTEAALRLDSVTKEERERVRSLVDDISTSRSELEALNGLPDDKRNPDEVGRVGARLAGSETALAELDEAIGRRIPKYAQLRNPKPIDLVTAQKWCGKDRVVLEYVMWDPSLEQSLSEQHSITVDGTTYNFPNIKLGSYCIIVSSDGIDYVRLDGDYDYVGAINKLRGFILRRWSFEKMEPLRNELYVKLIEPVVAKLPVGTKEIVVVPDGPIAYLPLDILRRDASCPVFGESYSVALSPSISVSALSSIEEGKSQGNALALGGGWYNPEKNVAERGCESRGYTRSGDSGQSLYYSEDELRSLNPAQLANARRVVLENGAGRYFSERGFRWTDIPGTAREVRNLQDFVFPVGQITLLEGQSASEANLKRLSEKGALKDYSVIHLACHGYFDTMIPDMSSVVLSEVSGLLKDDPEDGYLTIAETVLLDLDADMVNLSACETGLAQVRRGDGMIGLARSFLIAGARNVGVSLWSVDDEATTEFMTRLYKKAVGSGIGFQKAYTAVKAEFREDPKWSHPYYWAAFTMYE